MSAYFNANLTHVVVKDEAVNGTLIAMTDADFDIRAYNITFTPTIGFDDEGSKHATGDHAEDESIAEIQTGTVEFETKYVWGGAVATAPNQAKLFSACGLVETAYTTTGIGWTPEKAADENCVSIRVYGVQIGTTPAAISFDLAGCVGNVAMSCEGIGMPIKCKWSFTGKFSGVTDVANGSELEPTGMDTTLAEKLVSSAFTIGGTAACISSWTLDFGNDVQPIYCQSESTGVLNYHIADRNPRFSCNPLMVAKATIDYYGDSLAQTIKALSLTFGTNHLILTAPRAQLMSPTVAAREGKHNWELNYKLLRNTAGSTAAEKERTFQLLQGAIA